MDAYEIFKKINFTDGLDEVVIPGDIEELPMYIFNNRNFLTVKLEYGVKIIGKYAFSNCHYLKKIFIPPTVTHIKEGAFLNCNALVNISFEIGSILEIGNYAFPEKGFQFLNLGYITNFEQITKFKELDKYRLKCYQEIEVVPGMPITVEHTFQHPNTRTKETIQIYFPFPHYINRDIDLGMFSQDNFPITKISNVYDIHNKVPIILGTLDGKTYPVVGWGECRGFNVNGLMKLAKEQNQTLRSAEWSFALSWFEKPTKAFLLDQYLLKVCKGELFIQEPILITWD